MSDSGKKMFPVCLLKSTTLNFLKWLSHFCALLPQITVFWLLLWVVWWVLVLDAAVKSWSAQTVVSASEIPFFFCFFDCETAEADSSPNDCQLIIWCVDTNTQKPHKTTVLPPPKTLVCLLSWWLQVLLACTVDGRVCSRSWIWSLAKMLIVNSTALLCFHPWEEKKLFFTTVLEGCCSFFALDLASISKERLAPCFFLPHVDSFKASRCAGRLYTFRLKTPRVAFIFPFYLNIKKKQLPS